jgi:hypothetical protein
MQLAVAKVSNKPNLKQTNAQMNSSSTPTVADAQHALHTPARAM